MWFFEEGGVVIAQVFLGLYVLDLEVRYFHCFLSTLFNFQFFFPAYTFHNCCLIGSSICVVFGLGRSWTRFSSPSCSINASQCCADWNLGAIGIAVASAYQCIFFVKCGEYLTLDTYFTLNYFTVTNRFLCFYCYFFTRLCSM